MSAVSLTKREWDAVSRYIAAERERIKFPGPPPEPPVLPDEKEDPQVAEIRQEPS